MFAWTTAASFSFSTWVVRRLCGSPALTPTRRASLAPPFRALADPTRLTLALALREGGELCVCDLAWILERAQNLVSHHLRALRAEGLVESRREGKMVLYSLTERGRALPELTGTPIGWAPRDPPASRPKKRTRLPQDHRSQYSDQPGRK